MVVRFETQQMIRVFGFVEDIAHRRVAVEIAGGELEVALGFGGDGEAGVARGAAARIEWCDNAPLSRCCPAAARASLQARSHVAKRASERLFSNENFTAS